MLRYYAAQDPTAKLLQKTEFPRLLKELLNICKPEQHLVKAFEKCGLVPINVNKILERIPSTVRSQDVARHLDAALLKKNWRSGGLGLVPRNPEAKKFLLASRTAEWRRTSRTAVSRRRWWMSPMMTRRKRAAVKRTSRVAAGGRAAAGSRAAAGGRPAARSRRRRTRTVRMRSSLIY